MQLHILLDLTFIMLTVALIGSIFMIALDTNIIGVSSTQLSINIGLNDNARHCYSKNNDPIPQSEQYWLV